MTKACNRTWRAEHGVLHGQYRKKEEMKWHTTEIRMLRWVRENTKLDHVRNVDIWEEAHMYPMGDFHTEKMLILFGHRGPTQMWDNDEAMPFARTKNRRCVGHRNTERYTDNSVRVGLLKETDKIRIKRGVPTLRQDDTISPNMFTATLNVWNAYI